MNRSGMKCVLYPRVSTEMQIDYILVYKISRFGRNAADILNSLEFIQSYGINLICIEEGIDSSQASGKLLISVLSAVAEIERENIIEQTMNGRKEKEAEAIRLIYDKFANTDIGYNGVAQYLNLQGIEKIQRQNGKLKEWSGSFVRQILDNPVYSGKIAFGRRAREKIKGTKNEYRQAWQEDYILAEGKHEAIISEELWNKVREKRIETGIKQPSKIGKNRVHLLSGILKCPTCGDQCILINMPGQTKTEHIKKFITMYAVEIVMYEVKAANIKQC